MKNFLFGYFQLQLLILESQRVAKKSFSSPSLKKYLINKLIINKKKVPVHLKKGQTERFIIINFFFEGTPFVCTKYNFIPIMSIFWVGQKSRKKEKRIDNRIPIMRNTVTCCLVSLPLHYPQIFFPLPIFSCWLPSSKILINLFFTGLFRNQMIFLCCSVSHEFN